MNKVRPVPVNNVILLLATELLTYKGDLKKAVDAYEKKWIDGVTYEMYVARITANINEYEFAIKILKMNTPDGTN